MSRNGSSDGFCIVTACCTRHPKAKKKSSRTPYRFVQQSRRRWMNRCLHARTQPNHRAFAANQCEQSMESAEQQLSGGRGAGARGRSGSGASTASSSLAASSSRRSSSSSRSRSSSSSSKIPPTTSWRQSHPPSPTRTHPAEPRAEEPHPPGLP